MYREIEWEAEAVELGGGGGPGAYAPTKSPGGGQFRTCVQTYSKTVLEYRAFGHDEAAFRWNFVLLYQKS